MLNKWIELNEIHKHIPEQDNLDTAVHFMWPRGLNMYELPESYVRIYDDYIGGKDKPVIEHYQASRKHK
jgi:hypothetical protein